MLTEVSVQMSFSS